MSSDDHTALCLCTFDQLIDELAARYPEVIVLCSGPGNDDESAEANPGRMDYRGNRLTLLGALTVGQQLFTRMMLEGMPNTYDGPDDDDDDDEEEMETV